MGKTTRIAANLAALAEVSRGVMEEIYCFAGNPLDRASERRRDGEWIRSLLDDPAARILPLFDLRPATLGSDSPMLDWQPLEPWRDKVERGATLVFLGLDEGRPP